MILPFRQKFVSYLQLNLAVSRCGIDQTHGVRHAAVTVVQLHGVHRVPWLMLRQLKLMRGVQRLRESEFRNMGLLPTLHQECTYLELGMAVSLSQAEPGRTDEQDQEEISAPHAQAISVCLVHFLQNSYVYQ